MKALIHILSGIICLFITISLHGQNSSQQHRIDSLTAKFKRDSTYIYRFKKVRPFAAIDNRNSFSKDRPNVKGFQLGVILKEKHTVGFGIYNLQDKSKYDATTKTDNNIPIKRNLTLNYMTVFYQYVIIDRRFFELDLPLEVGLGSYRMTIEDTLSHKVISEKRGGVSVTSGGVNLIFKPIKWVGISGTVGYRLALDRNPNINFSGAYYSVGLWVDLRQIYRDTRFYGFTRKKYRRQLKALRF